VVSGSLLLDTNVLICALNQTRQSAIDLLTDAEPSRLAISVITWMEVMAGAPAGTEAETRRFLRGFESMGVSDTIADRAVQVRKSTKLKLPDAIIYATALVSRRTLVTYNTRDFPAGSESVYTPNP
jgi:predicted nucleic acid-binding protein